MRKKWTPSTSKNTRFLSGRIPEKLWDAVDSNAKSTGRTRTEVMIAAVSQYLELPNPIFDLHSKTAEIEQNLVAIEEQLKDKFQALQSALQELKGQNEQLAGRLSAIESAKSDAPKKPMFSTDAIWDKHYGNGKK